MRTTSWRQSRGWQAEIQLFQCLNGVGVAGSNLALDYGSPRLASNNIAFLPVSEGDKLIGVVTDRDLVVRVMAAARGSSLLLIRPVSRHSNR